MPIMRFLGQLYWRLWRENPLSDIWLGTKLPARQVTQGWKLVGSCGAGLERVRVKVILKPVLGSVLLGIWRLEN